MALFLFSVSHPARAMELEGTQISSLQALIQEMGGVADFPTMHLFAYVEGGAIILVTVTPADLDKTINSRCTVTIILPLDSQKVYMTMNCAGRLSDKEVNRLTNEMAGRAGEVIKQVLIALGQRI